MGLLQTEPSHCVNSPIPPAHPPVAWHRMVLLNVWGIQSWKCCRKRFQPHCINCNRLKIRSGTVMATGVGMMYSQMVLNVRPIVRWVSRQNCSIRYSNQIRAPSQGEQQTTHPLQASTCGWSEGVVADPGEAGAGWGGERVGARRSAPMVHSQSCNGHRQSREKEKLLTIHPRILSAAALLQQHSNSADTESERVSWVASSVICSLGTGFSRAAVFNFNRTKRRETRMVDKEAKLRHQPWVIITPFGVLHYSP